MVGLPFQNWLAHGLVTTGPSNSCCLLFRMGPAPVNELFAIVVYHHIYQFVLELQAPVLCPRIPSASRHHADQL